MRFLYTTSTLPADDHDGEPRFVLDLATAVARQGHQVTILAPRYVGAPLRTKISGIPIRFYNYWSNTGANLAYPGAILPKLRQSQLNKVKAVALCSSLVLATRQAIRDLQPDLIHAHWLIPQGVALSFVPPSVPLFCTAYAADIFTFNRGPGAWLKQRALQRFQAVATGSPEGERFLRQHYPLTAYRYIPQGYNSNYFHPGDFRDRVACHLGFVGRITEKKGIHVLFQALELLSDLPWQMSLVGKTEEPYSARLIHQRDASPLLRERVSLLPAVGHAELGQVMRSFDVFCHPSVITAEGDRDGVPTSMIEAVACGLPIIGTDVGGLGNLLREAHGLIAQPNQVQGLAALLRQVITQPQLRLNMRKGSLQAAQSYSWDAIATRVLDMYAGRA